MDSCFSDGHLITLIGHLKKKVTKFVSWSMEKNRMETFVDRSCEKFAGQSRKNIAEIHQLDA